MRHKHTLPEHLLTVSSVALIAAVMFVQAHIALRPGPTPMFSFGLRNIVFGYGTDECSSIITSDSFEDGTLLPFGTTEGASWTVVSGVASHGSRSAKAPTIASSDMTTLSLEVSVASDGIVSFYRRVSSEQNFDFLRFYIDGVLQESWSGEVSWAEESYTLPSSGVYSLEWVYSKDDSSDEGSDTAWIDMVRVGESCGASSTSSSSIASSSSSSSQAPVCGNGVRQTGETCDDGDTTAGDGCSATCTVESGWSCAGNAPDVCIEVCGNGIITSGEACDDGNTSNSDGCSSACAEESGWSCTGEPSTCTTTCGDGIAAGAEACDDGNDTETDACLSSCVAASCGDGHIQDGEACDDAGESATCDADCTAVACGDQRVNTLASEQCDDGNDSNADACLNSCLTPYCGDTFLRSGVEQCEPPGQGTCADNCTLATGIGRSFTESEPEPPKRQGPPPSCGNGILQPDKGEKCDAGRFNGLSPTCDRWCGITYCGDGKVHPESEECEPGQDENGSYVVKTCGGKSCTVPICDDEGTCIGGCRWVFLPACREIPLEQEPEPDVFASSSSEALASVPAADSSSSEEQRPAAGEEPVSSSSAAASSAPAAPASSSAAPVAVASSAPAVSSAAAGSAPAASSASSASSLFSPVNQSALVPVCGNGVTEGAEECDDGTGNTDTAADSCRRGCRFARCGDRVIDTGEQCDDGNDILGDGCTPLCTRSTCGNGVLEQGEECDEGPRNTDTAPDSCSTSCLLPRCGDGLMDVSFGEACDDGASNSNTQPDACRLNCTPPRCGDGVKDSGEQCDDGNVNNNDFCTGSCKAVACGNGVKDWNEACDDGNTANGDGCSNSCLNESESFLDWFRRTMGLPFGW